jgi:hypothetical protein
MIAMHVLGFKRFFLLWTFLLPALLPGILGAQLRPVVSNEIAVSSREATLRLDFEDQEALTISLKDGEVLVDGQTVGSYTRGDGLDQAWRSLLGDVISLDDGPLATALYDWTPPDDLTDLSGDVADMLDQTLEGTLSAPQETPGGQEPSAEITLNLSSDSSVLGALFRRSEALRGLGEALQETTPDNFVLKIGEDVDVGEGDLVEHSMIVVDGDLDVEGTIRGDVIVTNGSVRLLDGGHITGDLRVVNGEVESLGGEVDGEILRPSSEAELGARDLQSLREDLEREIRREVIRSVERDRRSSSSSFWNPFRNVGRAIAGLLENLVTFLVLVVLGLLMVHFGRERLEVVATTARRAPAQSAMVGLAGGFLLIPVWILGMVALAVSIVGIPVLLAWIPLFPLAAGLAALLGYVAVARNIGEWVADQEYRGLEWIRGSNTFYVVIAGIGALMVPAVVASLVRILGLGFLHGLLGFLGSAITFIAVSIGFGAVLLTRGGRIRPYASYYDFDEDLWEERGGTAEASRGDGFGTRGAGVPREETQGEPGTAATDDAREPDGSTGDSSENETKEDRG